MPGPNQPSPQLSSREAMVTGAGTFDGFSAAEKFEAPSIKAPNTYTWEGK